MPRASRTQVISLCWMGVAKPEETSCNQRDKKGRVKRDGKKMVLKKRGVKNPKTKQKTKRVIRF